MCGIAGIVSFHDQPVSGQALQAMTESMTHRGPDGEGYVFLAPRTSRAPIVLTGDGPHAFPHISKDYSIGFGHRRLAVLDPTSDGQQPMGTEDGLFWLTYNGEIYNYKELKQELQELGWAFHSKTDTEVVLRAYQQWGVESLHRFNGMFAFALWDAPRQRLFCARDRLGMKPFYHTQLQDRFIFGSEIKALLSVSGMMVNPNPRMIHDFLILSLQDHSEETFFEHVKQLEPGHYLLLEGSRLECRRWWSLPLHRSPSMLHDGDAVGKFKELFRDAVRVHLRSDVPIGSCLSGGLDSSSIVCTTHSLFSTQATDEGMASRGFPFHTFSSCFDNPVFDERKYIRPVLSQTGVQNTEVYPEPRRLFEQLPDILWFQDEPMGGTSYLAQWAVMESASQHGVKVLLDGQGGDELLCGYPGYWGSYFGDLCKSLSLVTLLRTGWAYAKKQPSIHQTVWSNLARAVLPSRSISTFRFGLKGHRLWVNLDFSASYSDRHRLLDYGNHYDSSLDNHLAAYLQTHSLPALLHHEDRNSMAFSIEARLPFLDVRLLEFLLSLPANQKLHSGQSKFLLRQAMTGVLPPQVNGRMDKMGFVTPQDYWLRGPLRPDIEEIFHSQTFRFRSYWNADKMQTLYRTYCEGKAGMGATVWRCLNLELWLRRFFP